MKLLNDFQVAYRSQKKAVSLALFSFFSIALILVAVLYLVSANLDLRQSASTSACVNGLRVETSFDRKNWSETLNLPSTKGVEDTRYYLRFYGSDGNICAGQKVSVQYQYCNLSGACENQILVDVWGNFITDSEGILRADVPAEIRDGFHTGVYRAYNSVGEWSNKISINFSTNPTTNSVVTSTSNINFTDYFPVIPGHLFIYDSKNNITGTTGVTRLQIEQPISTCGLNIIPWRFMKENRDAYWNNYFPGTSLSDDSSSQLRFMITDPAFSYSKAPQYNNLIWSPFSKIYTMNSIKDINDSEHKFTSNTASNSGSIPAYYLGDKAQTVPDIKFNSSLSVYSGWGVPALKNTCVDSYQPGAGGNSSWRTRMEMDTITISGGAGEYSYSGPALRADYMETVSGGDPEVGPMIKESWWFVKGVGLVKIDQKYFNGFNGNFGKACNSDSDCLGDGIDNPQTVTTLKKYYANPTFAVVAKNDAGVESASARINVSAGAGYCIKLNNDFTGYLEAFDNDVPSLGAFKWEWVENGQVCFTAASLSTAEKRTYNVKFRVWVPNDTYSNETRIKPSNLPWSNTVSVTLS